jgi:adenylate cyclase
MTPAAERRRHPADDNSPYSSYRPPLSLPPQRAEGVLRLRPFGARGLVPGARELRGSGIMADARKLAVILAADVAGYSRLAGADEERTLARLRAIRSDLMDPTVALHNGRVVKRTGDGTLVEFRSVVDAVRCAVEVQTGMGERNAGVQPDRRIEYRIGIHLGDVVEESDGDLMGDAVNIAARLEGIAVPGTICLSEDAYRLAKARLNLSVSDLGETRLKNIAERIRVFSLRVGSPASGDATAGTLLRLHKLPSMPVHHAAGLAALLVAAAAAGAWLVMGGSRPAADPTTQSRATADAAQLSLVVLPFANLSKDPGQDYFADGVTENLTTDLSRIRSSFVISRSTAFTFKGKSIDAREISRELGVRYVLEGSVQRDERRVRVNAQLIDGESGAHLWAERFEDSVADVFDLQDQVVARLANTLGHELIKAEATKGAHSRNPNVIDLVMRGWAVTMQPLTRDSIAAARGWFQQALQIDVNDPDALAGEAITYLSDYSFGWATPGTDYDKRILGPADRAIALAPDNVRAHSAKSAYLSLSRRAREALAAADAGLAVNANCAALYGARSGARISLGRFDEAIADVQQAMRLSPRDPITGIWRLLWGDAELGRGQYDAAIEQYQKAIGAGFRTYAPYSNMAAAYALAGKMDEARSAIEEARRLKPGLTVQWVIAHAPDVAQLAEGVRKAGLPEDEPEPEAPATPASPTPETVR